MNTTTRRWASTALLAVLGAAVSVATWLGGEHGFAVGLGVFYLLCCVGAFWWSGGTGDVAALLRLSGDERQRLLDMKATAAAGLVTFAFCLGGTVVDLAQGGSGNPWALILAVGGGAYVAALAVVRRV
jgi:hypothetical protein